MTIPFWLQALGVLAGVSGTGAGLWYFVIRPIKKWANADEERNDAIQEKNEETARRVAAEKQRDIANGPRRPVRHVLRRMRQRPGRTDQS